MANPTNNPSDNSAPLIYEITLKGHLSPAWQSWFDDMTITLTDYGETILTGTIVDQAALHGLLKKIRDLGMPLLMVRKIDPKSPNSSTEA